MRVALFTETYLPEINGVVTHVKALRDGLVAAGHTVLVVTTDANAKDHYEKDGVLYCPAKKLKRIYNYSLAYPYSRRRRDLLRDFKPDVIHLHNEFGLGLSALSISKKLKVPLVYTLHTMYDDYIYYVAPKPFVPALTRLSHKYFKMYGKRATEITGPSAKVQEYFEACGLKKDVTVIPNPVELNKFRPDLLTPEEAEKLRASLGVGPGEILVSFCGRLGREKSVDVLLDYWAKKVRPEDGFRLMILGGGPVQEELEEQARSLGIADRVIFTGRIEHDDLPPYLSICQLYITASVSDTNSISMKEAMAVGLPVLHIKDPLNAGQVVDGVNGFVYQDADEMYDRLLRWKNMSAEERATLQSSVLETVSVFSSGALAQNLLRVYRSAVEKYAGGKNHD